MTIETTSAGVSDECYRCGYALIGIADDHPCPECGLLAQRSRRATDELHNTRPRWLRRLSWGVNLMLFAVLLSLVWPMTVGAIGDWLAEQLSNAALAFHWWLLFASSGFDLAALFLLVGAILMASPEGYAPADRADRWRRRALVVASAAPLAALVLLHATMLNQLSGRRSSSWTMLEIATLLLATIGTAPLPALLFFQLRSLAKRARSAHLAEHCAIVGIGASASFVYVAIAIAVLENAGRLGMGNNWENASRTALMLQLAMAVVAVLFAIWSLYLLTRFAIALARASRQLRVAWKRDDRA